MPENKNRKHAETYENAQKVTGTNRKIQSEAAEVVYRDNSGKKQICENNRIL